MHKLIPALFILWMAQHVWNGAPENVFQPWRVHMYVVRGPFIVDIPDPASWKLQKDCETEKTTLLTVLTSLKFILNGERVWAINCHHNGTWT